MSYRNTRFFKILAVFVLLNFVLEILYPVGVYALTSGPSQPEFSSFTPVSTSDMVNLFSGDFNYNIPVVEVPGADGGGYALSLSYNSGVTSEQEASWVGFGWTLNPGAINRSLRGIPDEYEGTSIQYYNKSQPSWTANIGATAGAEVFSVDLPLNLSVSNSLRFNNFYGYTRTIGLGISSRGVGLNVNFDNDGVTFKPVINPLALLNSMKNEGDKDSNNRGLVEVDKKKSEKQKEQLKNNHGILNRQITDSPLGALGSGIGASLYGLVTHSTNASSVSFEEYRGRSFNWSFNGQVNPSQVPVGFEIGFNGSFSVQFNKYERSRKAYGYLFSGSSSMSSEDVMDYFMEKESAYDKRDVFLGMPFSNADQFMVSGEGVRGGFRAFHKTQGAFRPNKVESKMQIGQVGFELAIGANLGIGVDIGFGQQKNKVGAWSDQRKFSSYDKALFRFSNDMGGKVSYTDSREIEKADVKLLGILPGSRYANASAPKAVNRTNNEYSLLSKESGVTSFVAPLDDDVSKGFVTTNESGQTYVYAEPVKVRNETNLSVDIPSGTQVKNRYLAFRSLNLVDPSGKYQIKDIKSRDHHTLVGEIKNEPYASSYLLTEILSPTFVDVDNNGPSNADFGGWTKFDYKTLYGNNSDWYRYRTPYAGLMYNKNTISNTQDDIGTVVTGEKEIKYLKTIETKTHKAYFITNKADFSSERSDLPNDPNLIGQTISDANTNRKDAVGAVALTTDNDPASTGNVSSRESELEYLDKIVLYAKGPDGEVIWDRPLKIVRFAYDYSLVPGLPNNLNATYNYQSSQAQGGANTGKLTLKKLWFEYNGTKTAKISPYKFDYVYPQSETYVSGRNLFAEYSGLPESVQNPVYSPYLLGPWGYPIANAEELKENGIPWQDQSVIRDPELYTKTFDPAAWHLKRIKLPSGGEINIQYEENEYSSVQDRSPMIMASLVDESKRESDYGQDANYLVNVEDFGIDPEDQTQVLLLKDKIEEYFADEEQKIYFKLLYALKGLNPSIDDCRSEYITGYGTFGGATVEQVNGKYGIRVVLKNTGGSASRGTIPRQACYELVSNQKQGKLDNSNCINNDYEGKYGSAIASIANDGQSGGYDGVTKLGVQVLWDMTTDNLLFNGGLIDKKGEVCLTIDPQLSFLKLPTLYAKKGGGVRVKRLLFYDHGLEEGDPTLFGNEYHYLNEDGTSSGVATNEPNAAREENPIVDFIAKKEQGFLSRITAGEDKEQAEGPLGESQLPGASVGYSRVVVNNINSTTSGSGFSVHEYFTCADFPFDGVYHRVDPETKEIVDEQANTKTGIQRKIDYVNIPTGLFNYSTSKSHASQGFKFVLNNMHGAMKSVSSYAGVYNPALQEMQNAYLVSQEQYHYYQPGEKIKMFGWDNTNNEIIEYYDDPGTEMEMAFASKKVQDNTFDISIELDISVGLSFPPPIFVTVFPSLTLAENILATHATTKTIRYPTILKGKTTFQDGIYHSEDYLAFNEQTGMPILTRNTDSYHGLKLASENAHDGSIYNLTIPAAWMYEEMGPKGQTWNQLDDPEDFTNQLSQKTATFTTYGKLPDAEWFKNPTRLLSASVQTFDKDWFADLSSSSATRLLSEYPDITGSSNGLNKVWRPKSSFNYKSNSLLVSNAANKVYNSGFFNIGNQFDWDADNQPDNNWIKASEVLLYSPNGEPVEEVDVLDIHSAAIFKPSNSQHLPSMVAANASYGTIAFEDFEYGATGTTDFAHSGGKSLAFGLGNQIMSGPIVDQHLLRSGGVFMGWFMFENDEIPTDLFLSIGGDNVALDVIASSGQWTLYSSKIPKEIFASLGQDSEVTFAVNKAAGSIAGAYVDDIRFQPYDSEATCYVYDVNSLRLMAEFDDQHFGVFYQYNDEGQLVSRSIETERGVKTVTETQYNLPKELR